MISQASDKIVDQHKTDKNVLGILLVGSAARGTSDEFSDIDFHVILDKPNKFQRQKFVAQEKIDVELLFDTADNLTKYIEEERSTIHRNVSLILADGKILYDNSPLVREIQHKAQDIMAGKTKYTEDEIVMHKYSVDDFLSDAKRDVKNDDIIAFNLDGNFIIQNAIELLLKLNGDYYRKPKAMRELLKHIDGDFAALVEDYYQTQNLSDKLKKLEQIAEHISEKSGGELASSWSV